MLRHCVKTLPLTRCPVGSSYVTVAYCANRHLSLSIQRPCLPVAGRPVLSHLPQPLSWRCSSYRLFSEKCCLPAHSGLRSLSMSQPMPWCCTSNRQKNMYYGFASRNPPKPSRFAIFYYIFISVGMASFVLTPL